MEELLKQYLEKAITFEENGYVEEAIQLCEKCMQTFPEFQNEILLEIAKMNYRNGNQEEALAQFLQLFQNTGNIALRDLILEAYYGVQSQEYNSRYQENCRRLKSYSHFYGNRDRLEAGELCYYPVHVNENRIIFYDCREQMFDMVKRSQILIDESIDEVCLAENIVWMDDIMRLEKKTRNPHPFLDMENALLLVYQQKTWELLLQLLNLKELLELDRIVFYDDICRLQPSFVEDGILFPEILYSDFQDKFKEILVLSQNCMRQEYDKYQEEAFSYYRENKEEIDRRIEDGRPRILFITSRFSTAIQYHIKACKAAAERIGLEAEIIMEKDRLFSGGNIMFYLKKIAEFKPDVIFMIDHFRHEQVFLDGLNEIVFICWVQDPLPNIMDKKTPAKLMKRDILLNHMMTWKEFDEVGYDKKRLIDAPIPADSHIYKAYELNEWEKENYSCDICFVCHSSDVDKYIKMQLQKYPEQLQGALYEIYKGYQNFVYGTGIVFYKEEEFRQYVAGALRQHFSFELKTEILYAIAREMLRTYNQKVYRQALVDWLLDAGFHNIKLWGNGWETEPKYANYAMGPAQNGETLSKIYQASKIVLGNNVECTNAARAWESMLSGAFYMSNYVPPETDLSDIRKMMKTEDELAMFYDKEDLLKKVQYYLTHDKERRNMTEIGRQVALERMTFDSFMNKVIQEVPKRIKDLAETEPFQDENKNITG